MTMRHIFIILSLLFSEHLYSQSIDHVGELRLLNTKVLNTDTVIENICEQSIKAIRLTILAKTKVQLSCNYGDPSKNIYDTIKNKVYIYYAYDTTGNIHDSVISEIRQYVTQQ